jgi:hypothetical protein
VFWLTYCDPSGHLLGVVIADSGNLVHARLKTAAAGADQGAQFCEGHTLDQATDKLAPDTAIGRMVSPDEGRKAAAQDRARGPETAAGAVGKAADGGAEAGSVRSHIGLHRSSELQLALNRI